MSDSLMNNYARLPVSFIKGEGAWLYDSEGEKYLDALTGIAVCGLGHAHPAIASAIADQAQTLIHTSNVYGIPLQQQLADRLVEKSGMDRAFFCNSGAEANEAGIKLARKHGNQKGYKLPTVIVMENSFHGRTMATLSATGNSKVHEGFAPLVQGFVRVPFNDIAAIEKLVASHKEIVAVLVEPVQGEGGIKIPAPGYLKAIRSLCDDNDWLLMLDEVQSGMCRTGKWFACQHEKVLPDVMLLAKALGNGVPIGACLTAGKAADLFQPGNHGSTYGGNPLACRAALAVIEEMDKQDVVSLAVTNGEYLLNAFKARLADQEVVKDIRGLGMMIGIELKRPCAELVAIALRKKLLINVTVGSVIRLLPPLMIERSEADLLVDTLVECIDDFVNA